MAKLFIFAIGGTGSRVVKALTMLLASGVKLENTESIIPIIIDPDSSNGDLTRTVNILKDYKTIREACHSSKSDFFSTRILSLDELGEGGFVSDNFTYDIDGVKSQLFKEFIGYNELSENNKALTSLLFSKSNMESNMEVGFKGNPNIGSVVLNKFKETKFFEKFASNFEVEDRVFIISSIFGGTGAAGFPLVLKNIRAAESPTPHHAFLNDAKIGAVTVLPYFGVDKASKASIDSNTFVSKTIAALKYYADNICKNDSINALYYIGDQASNDQIGADGAEAQCNRAHFIELAAALSIVDFMSIHNDELKVINKKAANSMYFEFGLKTEPTNTITFEDLSKLTYDTLAKPLTKYNLFKAYMTYHYYEACENKKMSHLYNGINKLGAESLDGRFRNTLASFNGHFNEWLSEMKRSNISFEVLDYEKSSKALFNLVNGKPNNQGFLDKMKHGEGIQKYYHLLNESEPNFDNLKPVQKFIALHSKVTYDIVHNDIKL